MLIAIGCLYRSFTVAALSVGAATVRERLSHRSLTVAAPTGSVYSMT